jgi:hypothetical protein
LEQAEVVQQLIVGAESFFVEDAKFLHENLASFSLGVAPGPAPSRDAYTSAHWSHCWNCPWINHSRTRTRGSSSTRELKHTSMAHKCTNTRFLVTNATAALTTYILDCFIASLGSTLTDEITSPFIDAAPSNYPCGTGARMH